MNRNINYGLGVIMCQCRLINCNKCATLVGDVDSDGGMGMWTREQRVHRNSVLSAQLCCEHKSTLKK